MRPEDGIGAYLNRHILKAGDHDGWQTCALYFLRQRSTATRSRPSGRGYDDGGRPSPLQFPRHLLPDALHFSQRTAITASTKNLVDELPDPPFTLHVPQGVYR